MTGIRIDALNPTAIPSSDHEIPAMREGLTVKLTVGQIMALARAFDSALSNTFAFGGINAALLVQRAA